MNKNKTHKDFSKRFEREAEQGFRLIPGSEKFFNELENPFTHKKYKVVNRRVNPLLLVIELALMTVLLLLLKFTWKDNSMAHVPPAVNEKVKSPMPVQVAYLVPQEKEVVSPPQVVSHHHFVQRVVQNPVQVDSIQTAPIMVLQQANNPVDSVPEKVVSNYYYANYHAYYKLYYLSDLLVVDYGDSTTRLKLNPILDGVPASFETSNQWKQLNAKEKQEPFVLVSENIYLQKLEKGVKAFGKGSWDLASEVFNQLYRENPGDQNAVFYGALCAYEKGDFNQCLDLMLTLKKIPQPIFEEDADYYIALSLLKKGQLKLAIENLQRIEHSNSFYHEKAGLLLKEIR